jgi:hypothetical protein
MANPRPMPNLDGSSLYLLCVELYETHHDAGTGFCSKCGFPAPCPARRHAAFVIAAAGQDPRRHDGHAGPGRVPGGRAPYQQDRPPTVRAAVAVPRHVEGYPVARRAAAPYPDYER